MRGVGVAGAILRCLAAGVGVSGESQGSHGSHCSQIIRSRRCRARTNNDAATPAPAASRVAWCNSEAEAITDAEAGKQCALHKDTISYTRATDAAPAEMAKWLAEHRAAKYLYSAHL